MKKESSIKQIIFILFTSLTIILILIVSLLSSLDQNDYRQFLINGVKYATDYQLNIDGDFHLKLSTTPELSATKIKLLNNTSDSVITLNSFNISLTLVPLLQGVLQVNRLQMIDMKASFGEATGYQSSIDPDSTSYLPTLNIKAIDLKQIKVQAINESFQIKKLLITTEPLKSVSNKNNLAQQNAIYFKGDLSITNTTIINKLFNQDIPVLGPINFNGELLTDNQKSTYTGNLKINKTLINSDLTILNIDHKGKKLFISGAINIPSLSLKDIGLKAKNHQTLKAKKPNHQLFSSKIFDFKALKTLNLDINLHIDHIEGTDYSVDKLGMNIKLDNERLDINSAHLKYSQGQINADITINAKDTPQFKIKLEGDDIDLRGVMLQFIDKAPIEGDLNLLLDLTSKGHSAQEIVANLNGEIGLTVENGLIHRRIIDALFLDIVDWLFTFGFDGNEAIIDCAMIRYDIKQGLVNTELFFLDGPELKARGTGTVNLKNETINAIFNLEKKRFLFNSETPILIKGTISSPDVTPVPHKQAIKGISSYLFAPFIGIPADTLGNVNKLLFNSDRTGSCQQSIIIH